MPDVNARPNVSTPQTTTPPSAQPGATEAPKDQPAAQPSVESTPQQVKGAQQNATDKAKEAQLQQHAQGLVPAASKEKQIKDIEESAKKSGLPQNEVKNLSDRLTKMESATFQSEARFLREHVLNSPNTERGLRTYSQLKGMQDNNSQRLTNEHIKVLTRGVSESRASAGGIGKEGVMGQDGAIRGAKALIAMPESDYKKMNVVLNSAGRDKDGKTIPGSSAQMERALILKGAGARLDDFENPGIKDRLKVLAGETTSAGNEITNFAREIRGTRKDTLSVQTSGIDPKGGIWGLTQQFSNSCAPTTAQIMKSEIDPIYARKMNTDSNALVAEQREMLKAKGIEPSDIEKKGEGTFLPPILDDTVGKLTGDKYRSSAAGNTPESRSKSLDDAAERLKQGKDVPIRTEGQDKQGHFMVLTDVKETENGRMFLLTNPQTGKTEWVGQKDLSKTDADHGALTETFVTN